MLVQLVLQKRHIHTDTEEKRCQLPGLAILKSEKMVRWFVVVLFDCKFVIITHINRLSVSGSYYCCSTRWHGSYGFKGYGASVVRKV